MGRCNRGVLGLQSESGDTLAGPIRGHETIALTDGFVAKRSSACRYSDQDLGEPEDSWPSEFGQETMFDPDDQDTLLLLSLARSWGGQFREMDRDWSGVLRHQEEARWNDLAPLVDEAVGI